MQMPEHAPIVSKNLPAPSGPYSPGMLFERLVFVSGQGARDPQTGGMAGPDVETQTEQVLQNVRTILEAAGSDMSCVLRCGVFLTDLPDRDLKVEIDAIAYVPGAPGGARGEKGAGS